MLQANQALAPASAHARQDAAWPARQQAASAPAGMPDVRLFIGDDLSALEDEWRRFERDADCMVFQCFDWLAAWQQHIGTRTHTRPAIVVGRDADNRILFILPLATSAFGPLTRLTFLGRDLGDYNAPLLAPTFQSAVGHRFPELWRAICARLQQSSGHRHDLVLLDKMPARVGDQPNPFLRLDVALNPSGAYLTALNGSWDTFYSEKRSPSTRRRDRTKRKKLCEQGEVRMVTTERPDDAGRTLDLLMEQKARSFARMGVENIFDRPGYREFFRELATNPRTRSLVHVSRLEVGPTWAATNLGLTFHGGYFHVLASYDDGPISRFGPGAAHLQELLRYALEHGCRSFDFTIGDEPYKRDWSDTELLLHDHVAGASWSGMIAATAMDTSRRLKRAIKQSKLWPAATRLRARVGALKARLLSRSPAAPRGGGDR
jgi:CelD/BcsL family acetyltransferase involved in cellulose biosynthesis